MTEIDRIMREGVSPEVRAWANWYAELAEAAGSVLLGRLGDARGYFEAGFSVSDAAQGIAAGFSADELRAELDRMAAEAPAPRAPEWPDLTGNLFDERDRELEAQVAEVEGEPGLERLRAAMVEDLMRETDLSRAEAEGVAEVQVAEVAAVTEGYTLAEDERRRREAESLEAETELRIRAAEANRPDLAPPIRRPRLSVGPYVGSSFRG